MNPNFIIISIICACVSIFYRADIGLLLGIGISLLFPHVSKTQIQTYNKKLLAYSVVGLGFGMNIYQVAEAGTRGLNLSIATIIIAIVLGCALGKACKLPFNLYYLISCGTAICGGSAIAAVSKAINAKNDEIVISLFCVFILNAAAIFIFPFFGHYFELSPLQFGIWSALAIHDTSSVLVASSQFSDVSLQYAVPIKLTRAICIFPLAIFSSYFITTREEGTKSTFPWFILFFILASIVATFIPVVAGIWNVVYLIAKRCLALSIFLIGLSFSLKVFKSTGYFVVVYSSLLWLIIASSTLYLILQYY